MGEAKGDLRGLERAVRTCRACRLWEMRRNALVGEGDAGARVMLVALSPGEKEDAEGRMFLGPSGRILDRLLGNAGVARESVYMTNLIKCRLPKNRRPRADEIAACTRFLEEEIAMVDPGVIVPMGFYAARTILGLFGEGPLLARPDVTRTFGSLLCFEGRRVFPVTHPSALLYRPSLETGAAAAFRKLFVLQRDCVWYPACPMKRHLEEGRLDRRWVERYCRGDWESCVRYDLESRGTPHPDWMLPDGSMDESLK